MRRLFVTTVAAFALFTSPIPAEVVRFRYVPIDPCGTTKMVPAGPDGAIGEQQEWIGGVSRPFTTPFRPTHLATFRHPATCRNVVIPLTLPASTPRIEHVTDRIIHNYGSYTVTVIFLDDGSAEVVYNSGVLRPLRVQ